MSHFYINTLLKDICPLDAKNTIIRILKNNNVNDERIYILNNLENILQHNLESKRSPSGERIGYMPFVYMKTSDEFICAIREMIHGIGSMLDLSTYESGINSIHKPSFLEIYNLCVENNLNCEIGSCDGFVTDHNGNARCAKVPLLRISEGDSLFEFSKIGDNQLHVSRFVYIDKNTSAFTKIKLFKKILAVLFQKVSVISGSSATCDDDAIKMNSEGNWRFERKPSVFGFEVSKLFLFWLRCGGFPMRLSEGNPNLIYFYREDAASEALQDYKQSRPNAISPFFYASHLGIYTKQTLLKLQ